MPFLSQVEVAVPRERAQDKARGVKKGGGVEKKAIEKKAPAKASADVETKVPAKASAKKTPNAKKS